MELAKIQVNGVRAHALYRKPVPAGIIGAKISFEYDATWNNLTKTVVFSGAVVKDAVDADAVVTIPAEVVSVPGVRLRIGVYGTNADSTLAIPTLWADLGVICEAADPSGDVSTDPELPVWAQLEAKVEELLKTGGADPETINAMIADYLTAHPPEIEEKDPTVSDWAKQREKPEYTAAEVGALPDAYMPDLNAAERESGHILNRTHWTENKMVDILPECQPAYDENEGAFVITENVPTFVAGEMYIVKWNGTEYSCVCQDMSAIQAGVVGLGDLTQFGMTGNGEPFVIIAQSGIMMGVSYDGLTEVTISIAGSKETIHKLDNKYLDLDWLPIAIGEKQLAAEKTVTSGITTPTDTKYGFPDLNKSMVYVGQHLAVYFDGVRYEVEVYSTSDMGLMAGDFGLETVPFCLMFVTSRTNISCADGEHVASVYAVEYNKMPKRYLPESVDGVVVRSSTSGSSKLFRITVDDTGTLTVEEVE